MKKVLMRGEVSLAAAVVRDAFRVADRDGRPHEHEMDASLAIGVF